MDATWEEMTKSEKLLFLSHEVARLQKRLNDLIEQRNIDPAEFDGERPRRKTVQRKKDHQGDF